MIGTNYIATQAVSKPSRKSVKAPWEKPGFDTMLPLTPFQAAPQMNTAPPKPVGQLLIQGDDASPSPQQEKIEVIQSSTLKLQQPAMPKEPTSTLPVFAELEPDHKRPYKQPTRYQISKAIHRPDDEAEVPHARPSKPSDSRGRPAQTCLRFGKPADMEAITNNIKDREPTSKCHMLAVPNGHKEVTVAAERLDTSPQFLRDLSAGPVRHKTPEIERVMLHVASTV